ncbi:MAG TPA: response regulator [Tepidisphaeraceae bacterium]|nr:response regulator [Tepidisphaeraceae bacterium]
MGTVLVVDDSVDTCKVLAAFLARGGHRGICCNSVSEAFEKLAEELPDLIIADLMMPYESGIDLLTRLREDERLKDLPVIVYSAVSERRYVEEAMKAGATDYWLKGSLRGPDLSTRIAAYLPNNGAGWSEPPGAHPLHA